MEIVTAPPVAPQLGEADARMPLSQLAEAFCVPLTARGRTLGVLTLALQGPGRRFDSDALSTATDLASRAAIALDNALL
jgi:GAF domain-containing protein